MVLDLIPPGGWAPTFLTSAGVGSPQELLEQARATPRSQIRKDLAHIAEWQPLPPWAHHLADDSNLLRELYKAWTTSTPCCCHPTGHTSPVKRQPTMEYECGNYSPAE
jgi:hypothetical protein